MHYVGQTHLCAAQIIPPQQTVAGGLQAPFNGMQPWLPAIIFFISFLLKAPCSSLKFSFFIDFVLTKQLRDMHAG